jgi:hypothetical protein
MNTPTKFSNLLQKANDFGEKLEVYRKKKQWLTAQKRNSTQWRKESFGWLSS